MDGQKVLYEELRPAEFIERLNACPIAYLPLGTLEWHGFHLPLGADGLQAKGFFTALAEKLGGIVLPMLFLGPETNINEGGFDYVGMDHYSFLPGRPKQLAGTAYAMEETLFEKTLETILWNLSRAGFKIVVAHGHGPSTTSFGKNSKRFEKQFDLQLFELWSLGGGGARGIQTDHAAFNETSLVMALCPGLADMEEIAEDSQMVGIWGTDPRQTASEEEGRKIIESQIAIISGKLKTILAEISWDKKEMHYPDMAVLYKDATG